MFGMGMAKGMATTIKHFFGKKYTIEYPEQRAFLAVGFRGLPRLLYDDNPEDLRCVACSICANACPVDVIHIDTHRGADRKLVLDRFDIEAGGCVFCGFCVEACPFEALTMMHGFEMAAYNREQLLWTKDMLAIKATPITEADMERIHGPAEKKEEKKPATASAAAPSTVVGGTDGEPLAAIAGTGSAPLQANTVAAEGGESTTSADVTGVVRVPPNGAAEEPRPAESGATGK